MAENPFKKLAILLQDSKVAQSEFDKMSQFNEVPSGLGSGSMSYFKGLYFMQLTVIQKLYQQLYLYKPNLLVNDQNINKIRNTNTIEEQEIKELECFINEFKRNILNESLIQEQQQQHEQHEQLSSTLSQLHSQSLHESHPSVYQAEKSRRVSVYLEQHEKKQRKNSLGEMVIKQHATNLPRLKIIENDNDLNTHSNNLSDIIETILSKINEDTFNNNNNNNNNTIYLNIITLINILLQIDVAFIFELHNDHDKKKKKII